MNTNHINEVMQKISVDFELLTQVSLAKLESIRETMEETNQVQEHIMAQFNSESNNKWTIYFRCNEEWCSYYWLIEYDYDNKYNVLIIHPNGYSPYIHLTQNFIDDYKCNNLANAKINNQEVINQFVSGSFLDGLTFPVDEGEFFAFSKGLVTTCEMLKHNDNNWCSLKCLDTPSFIEK